MDKFFKKVIPNMFSYVFIPMLTLCVTVPVSLIVFAPLGNYAGIYFAEMINWLFANAAPVAGLIYVGLMPLIIMAGIHYAFFPTAIQSIQSIGYDTVLLPANLIHNSAQAGAAFAAGLKTKDKKMRSAAFSTGVSAIFGITEPAMYGVNLKYKKPFYAVIISGGIVGATAVTLGLKAYAFTTPGILAIPGYASGNRFNLILAVGCYIGSFVLAFLIILVWRFDTETQAEAEAKTVTTITSPVDGKVIPLSQVEDKVFAEKLLGKGIAVVPDHDMFYAPFSGTVKNDF
ncbi:PTS transporter subunit EIIC [Lachnospiraceae bacterium 54-53]